MRCPDLGKVLVGMAIVVGLIAAALGGTLVAMAIRYFGDLTP